MASQLDVRIASTMFISQQWSFGNRRQEQQDQRIREADVIHDIETRLYNVSNAILRARPQLSRKDLFAHYIGKKQVDGTIQLFLNFLHSSLREAEVNHIVETLEPKDNDPFSVTFIPLGNVRLVQVFENISDNFRRNKQTRSAIAKTKKTLFRYLSHKQLPRHHKVTYHLCVDFSDSPLNRDEMQKILWDIVHVKEHGSLFKIKDIKLNNPDVNLQDLIDPSKENKQYPEVQGERLLALFAKHSTMDLSAAHPVNMPMVSP